MLIDLFKFLVIDYEVAKCLLKPNALPCTYQSNAKKVALQDKKPDADNFLD